MSARFDVGAVVFDKDGVLADSEEINVRSAFEIFAAHGHALAGEDEAAIVGKHPKHYVPLFAERFGIAPERQQRIIAEQDEIYTRLWAKEGRLLAGAREALRHARSTGLGVGLATSSSRSEVDAFIERFELQAFFDVTLSLDDVTHAKPHPEVYASAARELGVEPGRMLVVEDSEYGIRSAKEAGAICVAVRTRHVRADRIAIADAQIDSVGQLPELLRS